jgi:hypothetical protein
MSRKRIATLVLVASAIAGTMVNTSTASASLPRFNPGGPLSFTVSSEASVLEAATGEFASCLSDLGRGNIAGPFTFLALVLFHSCTAFNAITQQECPVHSPGQPSGLLHIHVIGELGTIKPTGDIGALIEPALGTNFVTIQGTCITEAPVTGNVAGLITPIGKAQTISHLTFAGEKGTQSIAEIVVLHKVVKPKLTAFAGLVNASLSAEETATFDGPVEVT